MKKNLHALEALRVIASQLISLFNPSSVLDVGCGNGSWLRAFLDAGVTDYWGIDGVDVLGRKYYADLDRFTQIDFRQSWDLRRTFSLLLCLEVAEHLQPEYSSLLVACLTEHSDTIVFSAACPGQSLVRSM